MKFPILFAMAFSLFATLGMSCSGLEKIQGPLKSYSFSFHGSMGRSGNSVKVEKGEDGLVRIYCSDGPVWEKPKVYGAPEGILETVGKMVSDASLRRLKSNYKPSVRILDGWDWSLYISYETGYISSGGYMQKPPKQLWDAIERINDYIRSQALEEIQGD